MVNKILREMLEEPTNNKYITEYNNVVSVSSNVYNVNLLKYGEKKMKSNYLPKNLKNNQYFLVQEINFLDDNKKINGTVNCVDLLPEDNGIMNYDSMQDYSINFNISNENLDSIKSSKLEVKLSQNLKSDDEGILDDKTLNQIASIVLDYVLRKKNN